MRKDSLFADVVLRTSSHPENAATEALRCLLTRYPVASTALRQHLELTGITLPDDLIFKTQAWMPDQAIPDVVGMDEQGAERLIIEAKFWAGLTLNTGFLRHAQHGSTCHLARQRSEAVRRSDVQVHLERTEQPTGRCVR